MKTVNHNDLIEKLAVELKDVAVAPDWAQFVKTGQGKQRPPIRSDWWQVRTAAVLLSVQRLGPVGVSKLSVKYGTRKNNGVRPEYAVRGSRSILRKVLQQLEGAKLIEQSEAGVHKGRVLTKKGLKFINDVSKNLAQSSNKENKNGNKDSSKQES